MRSLRMQAMVTIALGVLSLLAGLIAHMALTDIYHGESDLTLEWAIVRICALVMLVFIGTDLSLDGSAVPSRGLPVRELARSAQQT